MYIMKIKIHSSCEIEDYNIYVICTSWCAHVHYSPVSWYDTCIEEDDGRAVAACRSGR